MLFAHTVLMTLALTASAPAPQQEAPVVQSAEMMPTTVAEQPGPRNTFVINPFALIYNTISLSYERVLSPEVSLIFNPAVMLPIGHEIEITGYGAAIGTRWYVLGKAPTGFFISPQIEVNQYEEKGDKYLTLAGKGLFGYHWMFHDRLSLHWAGGAQYMHAFETRPTGQSKRVLQGFLPTMEFGLGAAF